MKTHISIFIFSLIITHKAAACSCAEKPSIQDNWKYANQVFIGEVVEIDTSGHLYNAGELQVPTIIIRIMESFKLDIHKNYNYRKFIYMSGSTCDNFFDIGKKYLIYASSNNFNGFLNSSICSRTELLESINENEIEQLRKLYQEFKREDKITQLISDNEIKNYEFAISKSLNDKLSHEKLILFILLASPATIIILILIIYIIRRKKTNA
jgi:hypothetical protein